MLASCAIHSWEGLGLREVPVLLVTTEILNFSFSVIPSLQNPIFSDLNPLLYLDLTRCQISWAYDSAFHSKRQLKPVMLTRNLLMFLSDTAFASLHSLDMLTQTGITSMFFIAVSHIDGLGIFILGRNHISSLQLPHNFPTRNLILHFQINNIQAIIAEDVQALKTSNVTLILKGNDITYIEPGSFQSHFYSLGLLGCADIPGVLVGIQNSTAQTLQLTFCSVEKEPTYVQMFYICSISAKDLYLQLWHFKNLNADTFQCLNRLQKLDLTQTHIHALPRGMSLLEEMVLNASCFEYLCSTSSAAFPFLTHLHIKGNSQVLQPGSGCLEKLAKLHCLHLSSHIECSDCSRKALRALGRLWYLNVSQHLHLQDMLVYSSASLELLDLPFTPLHINTSQSPFQNLNVQVLNLSLPHTINTSIQYLFRLMFFDLSQNNFELEVIPKDKLLQQLSNLEVRILSSCELTAIEQPRPVVVAPVQKKKSKSKSVCIVTDEDVAGPSHPAEVTEPEIITRFLSLGELRDLRREFTRQTNESILTWLLRIWDDAANDTILDGYERFPKSPDCVRCTSQMWLRFAQFGPEMYSCYLATLQWREEKLTIKVRHVDAHVPKSRANEEHHNNEQVDRAAKVKGRDATYRWARDRGVDLTMDSISQVIHDCETCAAIKQAKRVKPLVQWTMVEVQKDGEIRCVPQGDLIFSENCINQEFHSLRKLQHVDLSYNKFTAFSTDAFPNLKSIYLNCAHNMTHVVPGGQIVPLDGHCIIHLNYNLLDCTCSKIDLITWYQQQLDKIDLEGTRRSEPKLLAVQLATISLSCGKDTSRIIAVVRAVLSCSAIFIWDADCKSRMGGQKISTATVLG
ncbi:LOW QUALITY PROTEIN: CD180 antigen [Acridotheres tristis]